MKPTKKRLSYFPNDRIRSLQYLHVKLRLSNRLHIQTENLNSQTYNLDNETNSAYSQADNEVNWLKYLGTPTNCQDDKTDCVNIKTDSTADCQYNWTASKLNSQTDTSDKK